MLRHLKAGLARLLASEAAPRMHMPGPLQWVPPSLRYMKNPGRALQLHWQVASTLVNAPLSGCASVPVGQAHGHTGKANRHQTPKVRQSTLFNGLWHGNFVPSEGT